MNPRNIHILPPLEAQAPRISQPSQKSGGMPALKSVYRHIRAEVGLLEGAKLLGKMNQKGGFDCSGCAWPDPDRRSSIAEYCENGAKALAEEATKKRVTPDFFAEHSVESLSQMSDYWLGKRGRITQPMILRKGSSHYEAISWEDACQMIADELNALDSPDEAIFYTSGRTSNEAAFMYQLFVRAYGTNNLPDCSNMCHESSGSGLAETVGIGKGSVTLPDLHEAELIMVMGQNPGTNHPRMLSALQTCKENGGIIVSVNPLPEVGLQRFANPQRPKDMLFGGTKLADHFLQVRINGDIALLKGIMKLLWEMEEANPKSVLDWDFIQQKTEGFEAFLAELKQVDVDEMVEWSGISRNQMKEMAQLIAQKEKIIICWAMGLTQHVNGVQNIREVVNLLLMRGSIGKAGAGTCPVRGHSNVQGDRTVGIVEKPKPAFLNALGKRFDFSPPTHHGYDTVEAIKAMQEGKAKVFLGMGGNFISATPDSLYTGEALMKCSLTVQVSTKLNRSHLVTGEQALILPCVARSEKDMQASGEQFVSIENSMGVVHSSQGVKEPASEYLLSEPAIIAGLAKATLGNRMEMNWDEMMANYDVVRDHIEAVVKGFDDYNERVRKAEGFYLPNGARTQNFGTPSGKAQFTHNEVPQYELAPDQYVMMTIRSHDQYNTTIYGLNDRYRGIYQGRRVVLMNEDDMKRAGFQKGQLVDLIGEYEGETRKAERFYVVPYDIPKRCVATYFPEANVLVPIQSVAWRSNTPASKFVVVRVEG